MVSRWLSVEEIAKYLGVVDETVYRWIGRRKLPAHRVGKLWKFQTDEVDKWIRSGGSADKNKNLARKSKKVNRR